MGELKKTLMAYARFADATFTARFSEVPRPAAELARRDAGVANNNLEASLSHSLQEPRRGRKQRVEAGLTIDAALRRLGATLITMQQEGDTSTEVAAELVQWRDWLTHGLVALAEGRGAAVQRQTPHQTDHSPACIVRSWWSIARWPRRADSRKTKDPYHGACRRGSAHV